MSLFSHKFLQDFRVVTPQISQFVHRWLFALLLGICACGVSTANAAAPTISEVTGIPYGTSINGVTYGGGKYAAITSSGKVYTSTDAESWTYSSAVSITSPRLTYFNNLYIVAGSAGKIYTSPDALTWTARTSGTAQNLYDLKAIGGNVYAVGHSRTALSSSDGSTWSAITINVGNANDDLMTITSGNGLIVISARPSSGNSTYFRSSTGASNSWSTSTGGATTTNGAYFLNDRFYAFYSGSQAETSTDAITWTDISSTSVTRPDSSTTVLGFPTQMFRGYHDGTNYLLFGSASGFGYGVTIRSTNGSTYTMVAPTASIVGQGAALLNGKYIQWGNEGLAVSDDGLSYHFVTGSYNGIATNGAGGFSLVGAQGNDSSAVSNTSSSWPTLGGLATRTGTKSFEDVVWDGSQYVAVGDSVIATSANGSSWTNAGTHTGNVYKSVLFDGINYVVSGYDGSNQWKIWRGSNLSSLSVVETLNTWFFRVKYENGTFFGLGYDNNTSLGVVYTSPDGITWTDSTPTLSGNNAYYTDAVWTGSKYVITGSEYDSGSSAYTFFSTSTTTPTNAGSYSAKAFITGAPGGSQIAADWNQGAFRYVNGSIVGILNNVADSSYPAYLVASDDDGATWTTTALDGVGAYIGSTVDGNSVKFVSATGMLANIEYAVNNTPTVTTAAASSITKTTASVGGDVTSDAGSAVTERGVVYALTTADSTPTYAEVNGSTVFKSTTSGTTGAYSIGLTGLTAGSQYSVAAYALNANGTGAGSTTTFTTTALNTNADLSALSLSSGTLSPGFAAGTISYTASVGNATSSITVTPTSSDSAATITVNGVSVTSGAASGAVALAVGANTVTVVVTAENGSSTKTYTVTVTRAASSNADLSGLTTSSGSLSPGFAAGTTSYAVSVNNATSSITVTPTTAVNTATVTVSGVTVSSGTASGAIALNVGTNIVAVVVTAQDGTTTKTYTLNVTRAVSTNADLSGLTLSSGSLSPGFASGTTSYTASVSNATSSITVTPTTADSASTVTVNGVYVSSGAASGAIALAVGANTVTVEVTAEDGITTKIYTVTVTRPLSSNADLSGLTPGSGTLSPGFGAATTSYTVSVSNATTSITITPTTADSAATVTVNGATVTSGAASGAIALTVGGNTVTVVVTAEDGTTTKTYTVTVTRAASSNADLAALTPSSGSLSPGFASGTTSYTASVSNATSSITITPTIADSTATVTVNGAAVTSGAASGAIALTVGVNTVTVVVTAEDGTTTKTYTVAVTRAASSNADLAGLTLSSGSLSPGFASGTTSYTASVNNATSSITVTPTAADSTATITVNSVTVSSGAASGAIALTAGANTLTVVVTAEDGTTTKTYTVTVTRSLSSNADLAGLTPSSGSLSPGFVSGTTSYAVSVSNAISSITVTPTTADSASTVTVNGVSVASGAASGAIALNVGANTVTVVVTAEDATTTKTYTVTVTRALSSNADLSGLTPSSGSLSPGFASGTTSYTASVSNATSSITVTPTTADSTATVTVNGVSVVSGNASAPIALSVGANTITVVITAADSTTKTYTIVVTNVNEAPVISGTPASSVAQGAAYSFTPSASDPYTGSVLTFSISNKPGWATFDTATGALTGTPANGDVGSYSGIVISVSDGELSASLTTFSISVTNVNDAPTISGTPPAAATQDVLYSFVPTAADIDVGATLTFSISNKPVWATFNTATGALTGTPTNSDVGSYSNIVISVSDGVATTALTAFSITVVNSNDAPTISGSPATAATQDIAYSFVPVAADADVGTSLVFSISNKPSWATFDTATGALTGTPANGDVGSHSGIVISVSDGALNATLPAFSITVANVNDAPTISGTPPTKVTAGVLYSFTPVAADIDVGTTLTFTISNKPTWATFNPATGQLSGTPARTDVGSTNGIVIRVSDGTASVDLAAFNLEVLNSNTAPVARDSAVTLREDEPAAIALETSDAEGDLLKIAITSQPAHGSLIAEGAGYRYVPATDYHGSDSFSFVASDAEFSSAAATVSLTISPVNDNPQAVADSFSVTRLDTDLYTLSVLSNDTDVDGDHLTIDGATASTGTVTFSSAGLIYQAPTGYLGQVDLRYSVSDGQQGRASAEVRLQITGTAGGNLPVITVPADVEVNATALYTKVDLGVATAVDRNGLTLPVSLVDGQTFFAPGEHIAYWQATDSQGNKAIKGQRVRVKPLISLSKDAVVTEGSDVVVQVLLNGPAPAYPVQVPYSVAGSANGNDHSLTAGVVEITSGTTGVIQFSVFEDAQTEGTENIQIALAPNLNLGSQSAMQVSIREDNIAPTVQLSVSQNGENRLTVAKNQSVVTVKAAVADQNPQDILSLQWNAAGLSGADIDGDQLQFDPSTQTPGVYMVAMTATDNGAPALTTTDQMYIVIVDALPALTGTDTDGDLIPDNEEGFADADGDGIADYLDVISDCNVVPEEGKQQVSFLAEGAPGVCLRRGQDSVLSQSGGLQLLSSEVEKDAAAQNIGGIFDFIAYGLPVPGQTYQLVLPQRLPVPANADYRKYNLVTGWGDFVSDSRNFVSSSAGERGFCPPPGDSRWSAGLTEGHWCVQVSVQDGGPNDADGIANGTIVDPGGVSILNNGNSLPVAKPDAVTTRIGIAVDVKVLANDSDADGDSLKVSQVSPQFGQVEVMADQQLRYTPAPQFSGIDRVVYSVTDGKGGTGSSELIVTVLPNNAPVAVNDVASTDDKTAVTIAVLANDSDADGDVLTVVSASAQQGTVTIQTDKSLRYQPKAGFEGTDTVRYVIADSQGMQAQGQVVITVKAYKDVIINNKSSGGTVGLLWLGLLVIAAWRRGVITMMLLMCLPATAQTSDWYGFVEAGQAKADRSAAEIRAKLSSGTLLNLEQKDSAFGVGAGYQISDAFAVELSYWDFGEASADISQSSLTPASYHELIKQVSPVLGEAVGAGGRFTVWQQQQWQLDVAGGVLSWQSEISSTMGGTELNSKFDGTDLYVAVSAGYQLSDDLNVSARWQRTQVQDNDVDLLALRLSYRF